MATENLNIQAYERGERFRLEVFTSRLMRGTPEFARTKTAAVSLKRALAEAGYRVIIFSITESGGLESI